MKGPWVLERFARWVGCKVLRHALTWRRMGTKRVCMGCGKVQYLRYFCGGDLGVEYWEDRP